MDLMKILAKLEQEKENAKETKTDAIKITRKRGRPRKELTPVQIRELTDPESLSFRDSDKYPLDELMHFSNDEIKKDNALKKFKKENKCCQLTGSNAIHCKIVRIIPHYGDIEHNFLLLRSDIAEDFKKNRIHVNPKEKLIRVMDPKDKAAKEQYLNKYLHNITDKTTELLQKRFNSF
jgi:hypothetical protein